MRILITGGFGYVGGRLAQYLQQAGHQVNLGSRGKINSPEWLPQAKVVHTDWNDECSLAKICIDVDVLIHLAGMNAQDCANDPAAALEFNGVSTANLLHAAIDKGVKKFIYLSTAHVYRAPLSGVITEETCPVNLHPYATSHCAAEEVVRFAHQQDKIEGIVVRLSNAFGAAASVEANCWMLLINDLCKQAITNKKMVLRSSGIQKRDFISLGDVVRAVEHLLHLDEVQVGDGVFNIGGQWAPRIIDVVEIVQERCQRLYDFFPEIVRPNFDKDEKSLVLDYRINKLLATGFALKKDVNNEIDRTLELCDEANASHVVA